MTVVHALTIGAFIVVSGAGHANDIPARAEFHRSYKLTPNGSVSIDDPRGNIRVIAWNKDSVQVDAVELAPTASDLKNISILIDAKAEKVSIVTHLPGWSGNQTHSFWQPFDLHAWRRRAPLVDYIVHVPILATVNISGSSADASVSGMRGAVRVDTASGDISVSDVDNATLNTQSGEMTVADAHGIIAARAESGAVRFRNVRGHLAVNTASGGVLLDRVSGKVVVHTVSGDITAHSLSGIARLTSGSGDLTVTLRRASGLAIQARSIRGDVHSDVPMQTGARVELWTVSGDISVSYS